MESCTCFRHYCHRRRAGPPTLTSDPGTPPPLGLHADKAYLFNNHVRPLLADVDDCAAAQCLNGATCEDQILQYECACVLGYDGDHCGHGTYPNKKQ